MERKSTLKKIICEILHNQELNLSEQVESCFNRIEEKYGKILREEKKESLKNKLNKLKSKLKTKYEASHSSWKDTLRNNKKFFEDEFIVSSDYFDESSVFHPFRLEESLNENYTDDDYTEDEEDLREYEEDLSEDEDLPEEQLKMQPSTSRGSKRKVKPFDEVSDRQKRRRVKKLENSMQEAGVSLIETLKVALRLSQQQGKLEKRFSSYNFIQAKATRNRRSCWSNGL